jgi:thioredoxin 1
MKITLQVRYSLILLVLVSATSAFAQNKTMSSRKTAPAPVGRTPFVTFVELGSVRCIPCRQMQPVMKSIEKKYGDQIRVIFHDVWKPEQAEQAKVYGIRLIPTQVFLDADGKEFSRHEGFYPEEEIDRLLQKKGLKPLLEG